MLIAQVMRGVGMSDFSIKLEQETASRLDPPAFDAWAKAQMQSLAPRLEANRAIRRNEPGNAVAGSANRSAGTTKPAGVASDATVVSRQKLNDGSTGITWSDGSRTKER